MAKWGLENMSGFFVVRSIRSHISIASIICDYFVRNFRVSYCFRNKFRATQKSKWLNLSGIRRQRPDSNLVFRIRYGEHNNIIVLITGRAVRRALFTFQIGLFFYVLCLELWWFTIKFSCRQITASFLGMRPMNDAFSL